MKTNTIQKSLLVGIGIASGTRRRLTLATPFDVVPFLIEAEKFRSNNNLDNGVILIAENPGMYSSIATSDEVGVAGERLCSSVQQILKRFSLDQWCIIRESSFSNDAEYLALTDSLLPIAANHFPGVRPEVLAYFAGQTADVEFLRKKFNVTSKFGWASDNVHGERAFDNFYSLASDELNKKGILAA